MKKLITSLIMFFILAFSANAAANLTTTDSSFSVVRGFSNSFYITLTNTGSTNLTAINLSVGNLTYSTYTIPSSSITLGNTSINLDVNQSENITITTATIPSNTTTGTYNGTITINYDGVTLNSLLTLIVNAVSYSLTVPSEIDFGTVNQNTTPSATFMITNNGNAPLTNVNISADATSYNIMLNQTDIGTLAVNESRTIKVNATIPDTESGGTKTLGNIYVRSTEYNASSFPLEANVRGRLEIDDLDVEVDGDTHSDVKDGEKIDEKARSESEIEFKIKIENGYTDEEDIEIENIVVTVIIEEIDDGDDLEEESDEFDLKAEESERVTLKFELPLEVEEGDYTVLIHVEGEDENNIEHEIYWELELEVEKESHEIKIRKASISPSTVICERRADIALELMNIGKNEEEDVYYLISNSDLGINIREGPFELTDDFDEDDNKLEATHTVYIKDSQAEGTYNIELRAFYDTDKIDDYQRVILVVNDCIEDIEEETKEEEQPEEGKQEEEETTTPTIIQPDVLPPETTFKDSTAYLALLGLLVLTVGAGIVFTGMYYMNIRKKV